MIPSKLRRLAIVASLLSLSGCASHVLESTRANDLPVAVELSDTPFHAQEAYQCGPAALATILETTGVDVAAAELVDKVYVPGKKGSYQTELIAATRTYDRIPYVIEPSLDALLAELAAGHVVLVFQNLGVRLFPAWHYAVVIGYDSDEDDIILRSGVTQRQIMSARRFMGSWRRGDYWAMVALRPDVLPASNDAGIYLKSVASAEAAGHTEMAIVAYQTALVRWPDNPTALFGLGNAYYRAGDRQISELMFRAAIESEPGNVAALNNLSAMLAEQGRCDEAKSTIERAQQLIKGEAGLTPVVKQTAAEIKNCVPRNEAR